MADYTYLTTEDVRKILTHYDLPEAGKIKSMEGGQANSSFKITCGTRTYILSVCDEKSPEEVKKLVQLLIYLNKHQFPTSRPVLTRNDLYHVMHHDKPVYIKEYMEGKVVKTLSHDMLFQVGQKMAALHRITPPEYLPEAFPYGRQAFAEIIESEMTHPFIPWLEQKSAFIESHLDKNARKGLIHGDIYWDNLLFDDKGFKALLDFEEACEYYLMYDIAMTCVGCCSQNGRFDKEKIRSLLCGYQSVRKMSGQDEKQLRVFIIYAAAAGSFWRFQQYNIKFPGHEKADSYKELASLADEASGEDWEL